MPEGQGSTFRENRTVRPVGTCRCARRWFLFREIGDDVCGIAGYRGL